MIAPPRDIAEMNPSMGSVSSEQRAVNSNSQIQDTLAKALIYFNVA